MSNLVHNEQVKLRASFFSTTGAATGVATYILGFLAIFEQSAAGQPITRPYVIVYFLGGLLVSFGLFEWGRFQLRDLKE